MSRYETYKSSEVVWIGDIPQQWKIKRLKDLVNPKITDGPHETPELVDDEDGIPFISAEAITENGINYEARGGNISVEQDRIYSLKCKPKRDDIFIVKSGSTTGRIGYVDTDLNFNIWSPLALVRSNNKTSSRFLYHFLSSDCIQRQIQNSWSFGTQPNIGMGVIERLRLAIPEYDEQLTIANYLDDQTQKIDRLIANKKTQAEKLKELRQIEINNAVTKGLNPNAEMKDSGIEWLGKIPKHWDVKHLKRAFKFFNNIRIPLSSEERADLENIYDYYGASGIIDKVDRYLFDGDFILIGEDGANLVFRSTPLAFKASGKFWVNNHAHILQPIKGDIDYNTFMLESLDYSIYISGSAQPKLTIEALSSMRVIVPPKDEQIEIANYLKERTTAIDQLIKNIEAQIEKLQELRKIKIYEAVTGKIKINAYAENNSVMSKYDTYKETDVIWFKELPAHWKRKRVKDVTQTLAGGTPDTSKEEYWEGSIPWLPSGKVQNSIINEEDADTFITEEGLKNSATKMLPAPATLIALTGATCSNIGYLTFDACANQSVVGMPGSSKILPKFLFYTLQSQKEQILLHQTGGAQGGISESDVKFLFIPVPIESEQLTIANYLDDQTQKIDRLIANKKAQAEKLKELRQIEINNAVTKRLNPNAEMKDSGIEWLGKIPKHWTTKRMKDVASVRGRIGFRGYTVDDIVDEGALVIGAKHINNSNQLNFDDPEYISWEKYYESPEIMVEVEKKWQITKEEKGYEIPFTKHFYVYQPLREQAKVVNEMAELENDNLNLSRSIHFCLQSMSNSCKYIAQYP